MEKILIIDDDSSFRLILSQMIAKAGLKSAVARDGEEGLEMFRTGEYGLVITDIIMPVMEGIETIMELRKLDPKVKIIAMSGGGQMVPEKYLNTALALKVNAVLKKPFSYNELLKAIAFIDQETIY